MLMSKMSKNEKKKTEFSKALLIQESVLIWFITIASFVLAFVCVFRCFGDLPWITVMVGLPWTAYGVSQSFYYKKSEKENTKNGIKYESVMAELQHYNTSNKSSQDNDENSSIAVG